jgi:hypothetical protein
LNLQFGFHVSIGFEFSVHPALAQTGGNASEKFSAAARSILQRRKMMERISISPPSLWMPMKPSLRVHSVVSFTNLPLMKDSTLWCRQIVSAVFHSPTGFSTDPPRSGIGVLASLALVFLGFRAGHQKQVALMVVLALDLHAHWPDFVGQLEVDENAGVVGLGRDFDEAPDDGEKIIAEDLRRAEVAGGLAGAMNHAVGHAPGFQRIGMVLHAKSEAGKILAVEQGDGQWARAVGRGSRMVSALRPNHGAGKKEQCDAWNPFHPRRLLRIFWGGKQNQLSAAANSARQVSNCSVRPVF